METRKIIGYKYPYETIGVYQILNSRISINGTQRDGCVYYAMGKIKFKWAIPEEIYKSFEPIYEEVLFGGFDDIIKHFYNNPLEKTNIIEFRNTIQVFSDNGDSCSVNKQNYNFTKEFEKKLKQLGIEI